MFEYVGPPLSRETLRDLLEARQVAPHAYHLYGAHANDAFVLDHRADGWVVFYSERGGESETRLHTNEADACYDLLDRVLSHTH